MGNGNYMDKRNIIRIFINSFTKNDVIFLSNVINENLHIKNKVICDRKNQYIIIIEKNYVNLTRKIVLPYIHPSMLYKLSIQTNRDINSKFNYLDIINNI